MATFNGNTWYHITETRVDFNSTGTFNSAFQLVGNDLRVFGWTTPTSPGDAHIWQLLPIDNGRYALRNGATNIKKQLGVCYVADEIDDSKTIPCMVAPNGSDEQKWEFVPWGDELGSYKFINAKNGSKYYVDVHIGSNLFMSGAIDPTVPQPAQRWRISSWSVINDGAYSTTFSNSATSTTSKSGTDTKTTSGSISSSTSNPSSSSATSSPSKSGLSPGAAAGIGVGVTLIVVATIVAILFILRRRKRQQPATSELDNSYVGPYEKRGPVVESDIKELPGDAPPGGSQQSGMGQLHEAPGDMPPRSLPPERGPHRTSAPS